MTNSRLLTITVLAAAYGLLTAGPAGAEEPLEAARSAGQASTEESRRPEKSEQLSLTLHVGASCENVARVLTALHEMHGDRTPLTFEHDAERGTVTITGPKRTIKDLGRHVHVVGLNGPEGTPTNEGPGDAARESLVRVFPAQHVAATKLAERLRAFRGWSREQGVIVANPGSKSIIVTGPAEFVEETEALIWLLDRADPNGIEQATTAMVSLSHSAAHAVAALIHNTMKAMEWEVEAIPDERTNTVLLVGAATQVDKARELIALWDVPVEPGRNPEQPATQMSETKVEEGKFMAKETSLPQPNLH